MPGYPKDKTAAELRDDIRALTERYRDVFYDPDRPLVHPAVWSEVTARWRQQWQRPVPGPSGIRYPWST